MTHLIAAGGQRDPIGFVESEAIIGPFEVKEFDERSCAGGRVGDEFFIFDRKVSIRANHPGFPVLHQAFVFPVGGCEIIKSVGVGMERAERGRVTRETSVRRIAFAMDDSRVGEQANDQPEIEEIVRQFVSDAFEC